jgi:hypothetical protein
MLLADARVVDKDVDPPRAFSTVSTRPAISAALDTPALTARARRPANPLNLPASRLRLGFAVLEADCYVSAGFGQGQSGRPTDAGWSPW